MIARVLGPPAAALAGVALLVGMGLSLANYYFVPTYWRYDLRGATRQIDGAPTPDVGVVVNGDWRFPSFFYYFRRNLPWVELPSGKADTGETLAAMAERYRGLWLVKERAPDFDPGARVEGWLATHAYRHRIFWVENVSYSFYVTDEPVTPWIVAASPVDRRFGDDVELVSYRASVVQARSDSYLLVDLVWRPLRRPDADLLVFAHLLDDEGNRLTQADHRPADDLRPTWTWEPGEVFVDRFALQLPDEPTDQGLHLEVGLYGPNGARVLAGEGGEPDGSVLLPLPGLNPIHMDHRLRRRLGGAALLGYDLAPNPVRPGESLRLTLYWRRVGYIPRSYTVFTHLLGPGDRIVAQKDSPPDDGDRPTTNWVLGEVVDDPYDLLIPPGTPPGRYQLEVGMYEPQTGRRVLVSPGHPPDAPATGDRILVPEAVVVAP
jgi:hypothetical protein